LPTCIYLGVRLVEVRGMTIVHEGGRFLAHHCNLLMTTQFKMQNYFYAIFLFMELNISLISVYKNLFQLDYY
jgi:hypothetical protein